jgi:hypothetical protein
MVSYLEYRLTQLVIDSHVSRHLVTASMMIRINPSWPIALSQNTVTLLILLLSIFIGRASAPIRLDVWVCIATTVCSAD